MIYFARQTGTIGPIKIGVSSGPTARLKQLTSNYRMDMELVAQFDGDHLIERNLHIKFSDCRISLAEGKQGSTEWFDASPALLAYIDECKAAGRIVLSEAECREQLFAQRYLAGETLKSIGDDYGISRERVRQVLRRIGVSSLGQRPRAGKKEAA